MTLQDKLDAFRKTVESGVAPYNFTPEINATMHRGTAELIASGQAQRAKKAGEKAPVFTLNDQDGTPVSSAALLAQGPLVLTFYRGVWCPYCNMELQALQEALPEIQKRGATLLALSPQTEPNSRKSQRQNSLTFPILSDAKGAVAAAFGLKFTLPDYLVDLYKSFGNDLPANNADDEWALPMPARYIIGRDGIIRYAEVNPDYTKRPDPSVLLPVLDGLT